MSLKHLKQKWEWFAERAHGAHARAWLSILSFTESSVFVIPPDPLLIAILLAGSSRWLYYATITTIASVIGAVFGYLIGIFFFDILGEPLIALYGWQSNFLLVQGLFERDAAGIMLLAAFTPIPYKVFVLAAGFLSVNPFVFIVTAIIGRGARYFLIAYATHRFGTYAVDLVRRYSAVATIAAIVIIGVYLARLIW